jgi:hypothetical protein
MSETGKEFINRMNTTTAQTMWAVFDKDGVQQNEEKSTKCQAVEDMGWVVCRQWFEKLDEGYFLAEVRVTKELLDVRKQARIKAMFPMTEAEIVKAVNEGERAPMTSFDVVFGMEAQGYYAAPAKIVEVK